MGPNNLLVFSIEMYFFEHAQRYVIIAITCYSYESGNVGISYNSPYSVALLCVAFKTVKQCPRFLGRP